MPRTNFSEPEIQELCQLVVSLIEHQGSVLKMPPTPAGFQDYQLPRSSKNTKRHIADKVVRYCLDRAKIEVAALIREKLEEEGLEAICSMVLGEPVLLQLD
jgi:hypothetical protein